MCTPYWVNIQPLRFCNLDHEVVFKRLLVVNTFLALIPIFVDLLYEYGKTLAIWIYQHKSYRSLLWISKLIQSLFSRQCDQLRGVFERRIQERGQRQSCTGGSHLPCLCLSFGVSLKVSLAQYVILSVSESTSQKEVVIFFLFASLLEFFSMYL